MTSFLISFVIWALLHSLTAASRPKQRIRQTMGDAAYNGLYRLLYNIFSVVTILPILYLLATQVTAVTIWTTPAPFSLLLNGVRLIGLIGLALALWQTDIWDFAGLRQAWHFFSNNEGLAPSPRLVTDGMYRFVRHPLYFFSLLILWLNPTMGLSSLIFAIASTLYFWIGSVYEERKLLALFGEEYQRYQQQIPRLLPFLPKKM